MYKRVVVPLDGSAVAEGALPLILEVASALDLEVILLRVVQWRPPEAIESGRYGIIDDLPTQIVKANAYLDSIVADLLERGARARSVVREGDPVREILAGAAEAGADLIAMTTHGRSGLGRLLFGSVAEAVLRRAEIPVFLLRLTEATVGEGKSWRRTA
jgi:nucleotide-binding universal stress UspA family protein